MTESRIILVSNRLPIWGRPTADGVRAVPSSGGLATGLNAWHERTEGLWCGWPGDLSGATADERQAFDRELHQRGIVPVHLPQALVSRFYDGFSNRVLWPLFHDLADRVPVDPDGWDAYVTANLAFADVVADHYSPGDIIWVHDYQLMLLPGALRQRLPDARIGFFLHIPFPASDTFRLLPRRREVLHGLLGADLIGLHTFGDMRRFMASLLHVEGVEADVDCLRVDGRDVLVGAFPMGIDAAAFAACARRPDVQARIDELRRDAAGRRIVLGVDRLDYTKGIPHRLEAIDRLLQQRPELRDSLRYIQVAVPSRGGVDGYRDVRSDIEERVGRINGAHGTLRSLPVHYIHQSVSQQDLVALYRAADVMLVTPLRDGMNLVAKEFVASRVDDSGVLVLSEFAGAAAELHGAMVVNPYDIDGVAAAISQALAMPAEERQARMRALRHRVFAHDVSAWVGRFVDTLTTLRPLPSPPPATRLEPSLPSVLAAVQGAGRLRLLLDYDGTLVPLARAPHLARPDAELLGLLESLATAPGIEVDIVSGRSHQTMAEWFGRLPVSLWAEHGFWHRAAVDLEWRPALPVTRDWMRRIRPILDQFVASTPGSHVEVKSVSLAWHYRTAPREFGARQAHELRMLLGELLSNQPLEVLEGKKVIEVRFRGISKAIVADRAAAVPSPGTTLVAIGDDLTDEELFAALPPDAVTVAVGHRPSRARFHLDDHRAVRRTLRRILTNGDQARAVDRARFEPISA
jgi:trehalose 6-phosphate synthase/phosphatase